jgi:hypothetical protein
MEAAFFEETNYGVSALLIIVLLVNLMMCLLVKEI